MTRRVPGVVVTDLSTADLRIQTLLYAGAEQAYRFGPAPEIQVCCSCGAHTTYGCTVPLADGSEPFACADCNRNPACWPNDDDLLFVPLTGGER